MEIRRHLVRLTALLAALALLLPCLAGGALAASQAIDTGRRGSLSVWFGEDGAGFSGAQFRLYRVADVSADVTFTLTGDFAEYPVRVNGLDSSGWRALAQTLDAYVARDGLSPYRTAQTDGTGWARFGSLPTGLYLVLGDPYEDQGEVYTPEPFLAALPDQGGTDGGWRYDVEAYAKYDTGPAPDTVDRRVIKVWDDGGDTASRPERVVVQLLRDGQVYDTVILSQDNDWRYTWEGLDGDYSWQIVEVDTGGDYTVSVHREGITFVLTNSYVPEVDIPDKPTPGGDPDPEEEIPDTAPPEIDIPTDEPDPDIPDTPPPTDAPEDTLPQTGSLWWPVPLLACGGLALLLIGLGRRRHEER